MPNRVKTGSRTETTTTKITAVAWERGVEPLLVAWVRVADGDTAAALRIQILPVLTVRSLHTGLGGPRAQLAALAAVERYIEDHRDEVEKLLREPPG
jgi:hypothetical protein